MKFNISNVTSKVNSAVGIAASITIGLAITLTAAVQIKRCVKDLFPHKKHRKVEVHIFEMGEPCEEKEAPCEDGAKEANRADFSTSEKPEEAK